jgi:guanylate kinase
MPESWPSPDASHHPLLLVLSGPSGVGKDAVLARMKNLGLPLHYVVTMTTRPRRPAELDKVDYQFVCLADFQTLDEKHLLLERANVYGNWYGVPLQDVQQGLSSGRDTIVKVDVQGAEHIKELMPQAISIFLRPTAKEDLLARLTKRKTESASELETRVKAAEAELVRMGTFDYVVLNEWGRIDAAVQTIEWIVSNERCLPKTPSL